MKRSDLMDNEFYLIPMISRKYSRKQREEIKRKEKEILEGSKELILKPKYLTRKEKERIKKKEKELFERK